MLIFDVNLWILWRPAFSGDIVNCTVNCSILHNAWQLSLNKVLLGEFYPHSAQRQTRKHWRFYHYFCFRYRWNLWCISWQHRWVHNYASVYRLTAYRILYKGSSQPFVVGRWQFIMQETFYRWWCGRKFKEPIFLLLRWCQFNNDAIAVLFDLFLVSNSSCVYQHLFSSFEIQR
jgi:hypothetical protein